MASAPNPEPSSPNDPPIQSLPNDLPPPYSAVVGTPAYGFRVPPQEDQHYGAPEPPYTGMGQIPTPVGQEGHAVPPAVGTEPTTVACFNCNKVVTTRVAYITSWQTHLVAGAICLATMFFSLCCLGLVPYCFDTFKDAEHYCPNCNTFIGKSNKWPVVSK